MEPWLENKSLTKVRLCYANVALVLSALTQDSMGLPQSLCVKDAINMYNQFSWRIIANNKIVDADNNNWIKNDKKYGESIRYVIGEAIGNCLTDMKEFAGKTQGEVVTFDTTPNNGEYSAENWNAVILYNYLHEIKFIIQNDEERDDKKIWERVEKLVYDYYSDNYKIDCLRKHIKDAISDIKEYAKELDLFNEIKRFVQNMPETNEMAFDDIWDYKQITPIMHVYASSPYGWYAPEEVHINYDLLGSVTVDSEQVHKDNFTPIKICIDNCLYYINQYDISWDVDYSGEKASGFTAKWRQITQNNPLKDDEGDWDAWEENNRNKLKIIGDSLKQEINEKVEYILGINATSFRW